MADSVGRTNHINHANRINRMNCTTRTNRMNLALPLIALTDQTRRDSMADGGWPMADDNRGPRTADRRPYEVGTR